MMRRRWDYFVRNLLGAEPPKEYQIKPPDGDLERVQAIRTESRSNVPRRTLSYRLTVLLAISRRNPPRIETGPAGRATASTVIRARSRSCIPGGK